MDSIHTLMTADELLQLSDDGYRHELIDGVLKRMTPAGGLHGVVMGRIHGLLFGYLRQEGLAMSPARTTGGVSCRRLKLKPDGWMYWSITPASNSSSLSRS
jgi:Uma2 family endonuclease